MNSYETNREARKIVQNELSRRGASTVEIVEARKVYLHATSADGKRTVIVKVKAKRKGNWHSTGSEGKSIDIAPENEHKFWIFVSLDEIPRFWIVPDWWIRNDIHEKHQQYLKEHGGHRPKNDDSDHHSIAESRLEAWQDKWEILGIF